jgi:DNA-binding NarL/FixJ family response regulator
LLLAESIAFDVALVDVDLGAECGLAGAERLSAAVPRLRTALLTSRWDLVPMRTARAAGAHGVIAKDRPARAVVEAVRELAAGGACELDATAPGAVRFVPREREILRLVGAGLTNAEIGASLFLAAGTIKHHMVELYDKLGAPNRAAAVHAARRLGVLTDHRVQDVVESAPGGAQLRVLVADSDDVRRTGLMLALHGRPWVGACSGARDVGDALVAAERLAPDVALVGDAAVSRGLVAARPGLRTLLIRDDEATSAELRAAGAAGPLPQWWTSARLAAAVHRSCHAPREAAAGAGASDPKAGGSPPLTVSPREREVLSAFATGATNPAIALDLGLSANTVKQHASSIFRKLGVRNRAEAVRRGDELGLLAA